MACPTVPRGGSSWTWALNSKEPISPLDKRYWPLVEDIAAISSEAALHKLRVAVEVHYLKALVRELAGSGLEDPISKEEDNILQRILSGFSCESVEEIRRIEAETRHDVAAVVRFVSSRVPSRLRRYVHFGLTSEDANNLAYSAMLELLSKRVATTLARLANLIAEKAESYACSPILGRTHGQPAVATTLGRELAVHAIRLSRAAMKLASYKPRGKLGGAVGTLAAHALAFPNIYWPRFAERFVEDLGMEYEPATKQVIPHDRESELLYSVALACNMAIDLVQDLWLYLSLGYAKLIRSVPTEVGSSTMPQKVNPVDIEGGEGMLKLAGRMLEFTAGKLQVSRLQRDLSDSVVKRFYGEAFGLVVAGLKRVEKALVRLEYDEEVALADLDRHWETLGEAVQTLLRASGVEEAYEKARGLIQGLRLGEAGYHDLVNSLEVDLNLRDRLSSLTPNTYLGYSCEQARRMSEDARKLSAEAEKRAENLSKLAAMIR